MRRAALLLLLAACAPEPPAPAEARREPRPIAVPRVDLRWSPQGAGTTQGGTTDPKSDIEKAFKEVDQSPGAR